MSSVEQYSFFPRLPSTWYASTREKNLTFFKEPTTAKLISTIRGIFVFTKTRIIYKPGKSRDIQWVKKIFLPHPDTFASFHSCADYFYRRICKAYLSWLENLLNISRATKWVLLDFVVDLAEKPKWKQFLCRQRNERGIFVSIKNSRCSKWIFNGQKTHNRISMSKS